jgi:phospholipase C
MSDDRIRHVFVLMLENRSFDHLLGFSGVPGIDPPTPAQAVVDGATGELVAATPTASLAISPDPPHEYQNVVKQLGGEGGSYAAGVTMGGFIDSYRDAGRKTTTPFDPRSIMGCQPAGAVPVLTALARQFAVCTRWFSSLPGPTWPNRFFVHAATSGGLFRSPSAGATIGSELLGPGFTFQNGTIFDRLDQGRCWWRVYHGDDLPQVQAIAGMTTKRLFTDHFERFSAFVADVSKPDYPFAYTFIEPNYGHDATSDITIDFSGGDSEHPVGSVGAGERLIKTVYEAIRQSPLWSSSLLVITYDEHGGFFDHVVPPAAVPPGDDPRNAKSNPPEDPSIGGTLGTPAFPFDRYGVRVPAVVISPYIEPGTVSETIYDHTSIVATVLRHLGLPALTARDAAAQDLLGLLTRAQPRTSSDDAPTTLPDPVQSPPPPAAPPASAPDAPLDPVTAGFVHLAAQTDLQLSAIPEQVHLADRVQGIDTQADALTYIGEVKAKMAYHDLLTQKTGFGSLVSPDNPDPSPTAVPAPA